MRGARPAEGPHPHGSPGVVVEGFSHEDGESHKGERLRKVKEDKKRKKQRKLQAWE